MIIDSHSTVFPDGALAEAMERAKPGTRKIMGAAVLERVLGGATAAGVDSSVTWLLGTTPELAHRANEFVAALVRTHPGRFIPIASVDPRDVDAALAELEWCLGTLGFAGLKLHPIVQDCPIDDPHVVRLVARAAEANVPVIFHVNPPPLQEGQSRNASGPHPNADPARLRAVLEVYDSEKLVCAHMGGIRVPDVVASRCTFQTTGAAIATIREGLEAVGAERVMFGSDFPFYGVGDELAKVLALELPAEDRERVLAGTALAVFGPAHG